MILNNQILNLVDGTGHTYFGIDTAKHRGMYQIDEDIQLEYLNSSFPGILVHKLQFKIGAVVMLITNQYQNISVLVELTRGGMMG